MSRLTRAEAQERNRAKVLAAARTEFMERGYREAKIDAIAERAELTRGAVYSNFPGKRALYFAVLAEDAASAFAAGSAGEAGDPATALGAFARAWVARLPLASDEPSSAERLGMHVLPEILADEFTRVPFAQLMRLDALLVGLALERLSPGRSERMVRVAETALTLLHGASQLAAGAPGFVDPFNVVGACSRLADLSLGDAWLAAPWQAPARAVDAVWSPPAVFDAVRGEPAELGGVDGVVAVLGLHRLEAVEQAVRAAPPGAVVTAALVTGEPAELGPLARLVVTEVCGCLRSSFPRAAWPDVRVVFDESGALANAAGVRAVSDETEVAVRVKGGRIVARAEGYGACHVAATA